MGLADELTKLHELRNKGALSEEEFERAKAALIGGGGIPTSFIENPASFVGKWKQIWSGAAFINCLFPDGNLIVEPLNARGFFVTVSKAVFGGLQKYKGREVWSLKAGVLHLSLTFGYFSYSEISHEVKRITPERIEFASGMIWEKIGTT